MIFTKNFIFIGLIFFSSMIFILADEADIFFDDSYVHEIRIFFDDSDWYNQLYQSHANNIEDPYFPARFEYNDIILDSIGVRFKGNSSFNIQSKKKSIKLDFDKFHEDNQDYKFFGLSKLNLNNGFKDPTFLRAKLFLDFSRKFIPTIRTAFTRVYINNEYWGFYNAVEQIDKTFIQKNFGFDEDGNLFKGQASEDAGPQGDFGSDLTWLGNNQSLYEARYQLKTNETENDYSQLIEFINILNNVNTEELPQFLEPIFDVKNCLKALALNCLFVNLDSYNGSAHNYYLYDRDDTQKITHLLWDTNEAFGRFLYGMPPWENPLEMDPFWLPALPPQQPQAERPLMENLWAVESYKTYYLRMMAKMLRDGFDVSQMTQQIQENADLIRDDVYEDINKMYSNTQFETNLTTDIIEGNGTTFGLVNFVQERANYLDNRLNNFARVTDLQLNEIMIRNISTISDENGDFDPWIEIFNLGPGKIINNDLYLSNDPNTPGKWKLPDMNIDDGEFYLIWLDGQTNEGENHTSFTVSLTGGYLILSHKSGETFETIDYIEYSEMEEDISWGKSTEYDGDWSKNAEPTPGELNIQMEFSNEYSLYINEFMASNNSTIADQNSEFDDWIELFNNNDVEISLAGYFLSDKEGNITKWSLPDTTIPAKSFLLVWADEDSNQTGLHANFKLSSSGEIIYLVNQDTNIVDYIEFESQSPDISFGRNPDGSDSWKIFSPSTPGSNNIMQNSNEEMNTVPQDIEIWPPYPNPFNMSTSIKYDLPFMAHVSINIYNLQGEKVITLVNEKQYRGYKIVNWNGTNNIGLSVSTGLYFFHFQIIRPNGTINIQTEKIMLLK